MDEHYIPKYINAQMQILWWDFDEFMMFIIFVAFGIISDHQVIGAIAGWLFLSYYTRIAQNKPYGFLKHVAYRVGLFNKPNKVPEFYKKELYK